MTSPLITRPRPILAAFKTVGSSIALIGSVVTALVGWGVLSATEGDAVNGLLGAIPGLVTLITALLAAFGVVAKSEPAVTPIEDPAIEVDGDLIALVPAEGVFGDHAAREV